MKIKPLVLYDIEYYNGCMYYIMAEEFSEYVDIYLMKHNMVYVCHITFAEISLDKIKHMIDEDNYFIKSYTSIFNVLYYVLEFMDYDDEFYFVKAKSEDIILE